MMIKMIKQKMIKIKKKEEGSDEGQEGMNGGHALKNKKENNNNNNDNDNYHEMMEGMTTAVGWIWRGTFDHEEGILEIKASDMSNFEFRRNMSWKEQALKCSCRTWDIQMVISTPD